MAPQVPMISSKTTTLLLPLALLVALLSSGQTIAAQGIKLKGTAVVLFGSAANCSQPATVNYKKVQKATSEWQTIKSKGVRKGSAQYDLLIAAMAKRIRKAAAQAASDKGRDCIVRKGDIKDDKGLSVEDLTQAVIDEL